MCREAHRIYQSFGSFEIFYYLGFEAVFVRVFGQKQQQAKIRRVISWKAA